MKRLLILVTVFASGQLVAGRFRGPFEETLVLHRQLRPHNTCHTCICVIAGVEQHVAEPRIVTYFLAGKEGIDPL